MKVGEEVYVRTENFASEWKLGVIERVCSKSNTADYYIRLKCNDRVVGYIRPDVRTKAEHLQACSKEHLSKLPVRDCVSNMINEPFDDACDRINSQSEYASHYKSGDISTREKKSMVAVHLDDFVPNDVWEDLANALKYMDRMGLKGAAEDDAYKCADYLHRALTGKFLNEVQDGD